MRPGLSISATGANPAFGRGDEQAFAFAKPAFTLVGGTIAATGEGVDAACLLKGIQALDLLGSERRVDGCHG